MSQENKSQSRSSDSVEEEYFDREHSRNITGFPPFLEKLKHLANSCNPEYGRWSEDGKEFVVFSDLFETKVLKSYFKGSLKTFIRQLHFYGFKKSENVGQKWTFFHPKFHRDHPEWLSEIQRKTRLNNNNVFASKTELENLKGVVAELRYEFQNELHLVNNQLARIFRILTEQHTSNEIGALNRSGSNNSKISSEDAYPKEGVMTSSSSSKHVPITLPVKHKTQMREIDHVPAKIPQSNFLYLPQPAPIPAPIHTALPTQLPPIGFNPQLLMQHTSSVIPGVPWQMNVQGYPTTMAPTFSYSSLSGRKKHRNRHSKERKERKIRKKAAGMRESQIESSSGTSTESSSSSDSDLPLDAKSFTRSENSGTSSSSE